MYKRIVFKAVSQVAVRYGDKWARIAGDKAVIRVSEMLKKKGVADQTYDLDTLTREVKEMYRQGRFNKEEWTEIKARLHKAWKERRNRGGKSRE